MTGTFAEKTGIWNSAWNSLCPEDRRQYQTGARDVTLMAVDDMTDEEAQTALLAACSQLSAMVSTLLILLGIVFNLLILQYLLLTIFFA